MVGAVIEILCGSAGFFLLARLCHAVCHKARIPWRLALANPAVLLLGLGLAAWLCPDDLAWAGGFEAASLMIGAIVQMIAARRGAKAKGDCA